MIPRARRIDALFTNGMPYVVLEAGPHFFFTWDPADVREFIRLWEAGVSIHTLAGLLDRDPDEVAVLVIDLARWGIIEGRRREKAS